MKLEMSIRCSNCGTTYKFKVDEERYNRWLKGDGLIQNLLYDNTPEERELLLSGICQNCWNNLCDGFIDEDEDEDEMDFYDM